MVNGSGKRVRSGAQTLTLLGARRNVFLLRALAEGARRQEELRRAAGFPAQSTLRAHLKSLEAIGAIAKRRRDAFPGVLEYELEKPGKELLFVAASIEDWFAAAPDTSFELGSDAGQAVIKALAEAWSATVLRVLAGGPTSLTELDQIVKDFNYPSLERRLTALRVAGLIKALPGRGRGTPYAVTPWLRRAVGPLAAAIHWERRNQPDSTPPIKPVDAETGLLLAVPLIELPPELSGSCRMAVEIGNGRRSRMAGAIVGVRAGHIHSCTSRIRDRADSWISGSPTAWLEAVIEASADRLELGGDCTLGRALAEGLRQALFGEMPRREMLA